MRVLQRPFRIDRVDVPIAADLGLIGARIEFHQPVGDTLCFLSVTDGDEIRGHAVEGVGIVGVDAQSRQLFADGFPEAIGKADKCAAEREMRRW